MQDENLQRFLNFRVPRVVEIRENYLNDLRWFVANSPSPPNEEDEIDFTYSDSYQCWVNYAPYFFRELMCIYMKLVETGHSEEELSQSIENKARVLRYFPQILLPGAFLDQTTPFAEKMAFLDRFSKSAEATIRDRGYAEPDYRLVWSMRPLPEHEKVAVGGLTAVLGEACEHVYFGEQPLGIPSFGIDTDIIPDHYVLYQDFDLNLGARKVSSVGRVRTINVYPSKGVSYRILMDPYYAQIFLHRNIGDQEWLTGRPHISHLSSAFVSIDGIPASTKEMERTTNDLMGVFSDAKERVVGNRQNLHIEYCSTQSRVIKNLHVLQGTEWKLPQDAEESIRNNSEMARLKKELELNYNMEVAVELTKRAIDWAKTV